MVAVGMAGIEDCEKPPNREVYGAAPTVPDRRPSPLAVREESIGSSVP
jgi:hypothetical protein